MCQAELTFSQPAITESRSWETWQVRRMDEWMDGVWRSSIHHMPISNAVSPSTLERYRPSWWRPAVVRSCRAGTPCSVSSHVLPLRPLDTCQIECTELDSDWFIAMQDTRFGLINKQDRKQLTRITKWRSNYHLLFIVSQKLAWCLKMTTLSPSN